MKGRTSIRIKVPFNPYPRAECNKESLFYKYKITKTGDKQSSFYTYKMNKDKG